MVLAGDRGAAGVAAPPAELLVQHVVREFDGVQRVKAPVLFGVELRMGVFDGEAVRRRGIERAAIGVGQVRGEVRRCAGIRRVGPHAVDAVDGVVLQVINTHPAALVGVGDGTPVLEAPISRRGDGAVHPARTRGRAGHDARLVLIEARGNLDHHGDVDAAGPVVVVREPLFTRDAARIQRGRAVHVDIGAVEDAVAAIRGRVHERAVVVVDRPLSQLHGRRVRRIREGRRRRIGRARDTEGAQPCRQEIVARPVVGLGDDRPRNDEGRQRILVGAGTARRHGQEQQEGGPLRQGKPPLSDSQSP